MNEITYEGKTYKSDGENMWIDGKLSDQKIDPITPPIRLIEALQVDDMIFYKDNWYKKA